MRALWVCLSLALLCGAAMEGRSFLPPPDAADYHLRVRTAAEAIPLNIGQWSGENAPVPYDALDVLKPNVMISRRFHNGSRSFWFQMVQCRDLRSLESHYPPNCYTAIGYTQISSAPREWNVGGSRIGGMEYVFARTALDSSTAIVVENFMVLPGQGIVADMDAISNAAADVRRRKYGAAEFQIAFDSQTTALERSRMAQEILAPFADVISTIETTK